MRIIGNRDRHQSVDKTILELRLTASFQKVVAVARRRRPGIYCYTQKLNSWEYEYVRTSGFTGRTESAK